jgi:two-component system, OmpR family, phosphate regulon sensor histidine kinase PhoR
MSRAQEVRSGLRPILLIVVTMAAPLMILGWAGKLLFDQNRLLYDQQTRDRLGRAADAVVGALQAAISDAERKLAAGETEWGDGAAVVTFSPDGISAQPSDALAYVPGLVTPVVETKELERAGRLEFRQEDFAAASIVLRQLIDTSRAAPIVRGEGLLRLARNLQRQQRWSDGNAALDRLSGMADLRLTAGPARVVAAYMRGKALEKADEAPELRRAGHELERAMLSSGSALTPGQFTNYRGDAERWLERPIEAGDRVIFAQAVELVWHRWRGGNGVAGAPDVLSIDGRPVTVLYPRSGGATRMLLGSERFVDANWWQPARTAALSEKVDVAVGKPGMVFDAEERGALVVARTSSQLGLPWNVTVTPTAAFIEAAGFERRRNLLTAGFALLVLITVAACLFTVRSVARELALAQLQSDFVAAVSHEFRTPLTTLRQFTEILREQDGPGAAARRVCYEAQNRATDRLTRLVESVLDLGRMEAGARMYQLAPHDAGAVVTHAVDEFRRHAIPAGYTITLEQPGGGNVAVDVDAFSRAIWNLLENAIKYSPDDHHIHVSVDRADDRIVVAVRDRGIGIPQREHGAVFRRFRRGEEARARGVQGTGIGLAMVDHIIRGHGGEIRLDSDVGKGSTFSIVLPVTPSPQES